MLEMKPYLLSFLTFLININILSGQSPPPDEDHSGNLYLDLKTISFGRNKEYFNPVARGLVYLGTMDRRDQIIYKPGYGYIDPNIEGYTLLGNFIQPSIEYFPFQKLSIKAGVHILNYSGTGKLSEIKPVISMKYRFSEKTSLTLGSLDGFEHHKMFDPLFDQERMYNQNSENGVEILSENKHFFTDTWVDWEHFIFYGDTTREMLTFGESFKYTSDKLIDLFDINIPFQFSIKHKGGQISYFSQPMETYINFAAGAGANFDINGKSSGKIGFDYIYLYYYDNSPDKILSFDHGHANWLRIHYDYKLLRLEAAWWKSHNFYAPNGNLVYSSISGYKGHTLLPDRSLLSASLYLTAHPWKSLEIYFGFDYYYDVAIDESYNAASLHISFSELIKLLSFKK
jgi:hypothetical protein